MVCQPIFCIVSLPLILDLIGKLRKRRLGFVNSGQFLAQLNRTRLYRGQVKAHMKIGRAAASLHIEDIHFMR